jgi:flagellar biosynthesis/type III secretory pathway protein FliH
MAKCCFNIEEIRKQTIDPELLSEIKDEAAWEKAKARFAREGREEGLEEGQKKGVEAQQRQTVINAKQMGMEVAAIATLVGLAETEVQEILNQV